MCLVMWRLQLRLQQEPCTSTNPAEAVSVAAAVQAAIFKGEGPSRVQDLMFSSPST